MSFARCYRQVLFAVTYIVLKATIKTKAIPIINMMLIFIPTICCVEPGSFIPRIEYIKPITAKTNDIIIITRAASTARK